MPDLTHTKRSARPRRTARGTGGVDNQSVTKAATSPDSEAAASGKLSTSTGDKVDSAKLSRPTREYAYFLDYQRDWIFDKARLRIVQKGRQIGLSYADAYDSVKKAAMKGGLDVWVVSRDEVQAKQYIRYCKKWAELLMEPFKDMGEPIVAEVEGKAVRAQAITFASGATIYALSSNPDAIVGKTGHVKLDEFALNKDQRMLYAIAKPVTTWGGTLSIISTHRGANSVFNELITDILERGNKMGWSLHTIPIQRAVDAGIVERIDLVTGGSLTRELLPAGTGEAPGVQFIPLREAWLAKQRAECIDEEQWLQEYCCIPADEGAAFISYDMITACEDETSRRPLEWIESCDPSTRLFLGFDVARKHDLSVIDVEEKVGDVFWERGRIEMRAMPYHEQRETLYRLLRNPRVKRCCIDATGLGDQLAEEAKYAFGYKVEPIKFTGPVKEDLAFPLRAAHEDRTLRYTHDSKLRSDLRGIKKETTASGNLRFVGDSDDSHCDRFWAKALALHAGKTAKANYSATLIL